MLVIFKNMLYIKAKFKTPSHERYMEKYMKYMRYVKIYTFNMFNINL